ncbi:MAG: hypothetical protein PF542_06785 [Nanoarchaeota archaeon]|jgi:hypothetical protein|nr:hypothetical protein [Nanoarchaeota archaeon]
MAAQDTSQIKENIFQFLKTNGPSLPIPISRNIQVDSLFTSAFLSELLSNQRIKISHMKVGGTPIYYVPGTEAGLEKYSEYLKEKEKEAYNLLRDNKFLEDSIQQPAIRVALRELKDFAKYFQKDGKWIWKYYLANESDYQNSISASESKGQESNTDSKAEENNHQEIELTPKTGFPTSFVNSVRDTFTPKEEIKEEPKQETPKETVIINSKGSEEETVTEETAKKSEAPTLNPILPAQTEKPKELEKTSSPTNNQKLITNNLFTNPLARKKETKKTKEKPKSPFCIKTMEFIVDQGWTLLEEIDHKAKEYNCLVQINSDLGPIIFKTQARDKKTISEADMTKLLGESQAIPLPALILSPGEPKKKAIPFLEKYISVLKFKKIE